jgi:Flp pilus assembly protein TadG
MLTREDRSARAKRGGRPMNAAAENKTKRNNQSGQSIVEIALITPLLLIALYIPVDFGVSFFMGNLTQTAAREGARIGSGLQKSGTVPNLFFSSAEANTVKTEVINRLPAYLTNKTVTVTFYTGTACMELVEVTAQGQYKFFWYQLMRLFGSQGPTSMTISRTTQMHYKYQPYVNNDSCTTATTYGPFSA